MNGVGIEERDTLLDLDSDKEKGKNHFIIIAYNQPNGTNINVI